MILYTSCLVFGVWYTRCISASRHAVCGEAREMTQHTEMSAHRAVHRISTKDHVDNNKQNQFTPGGSGATISLCSWRISVLTRVCVCEGVMTERLWGIWYNGASKMISWLKDLFQDVAFGLACYHGEWSGEQSGNHILCELFCPFGMTGGKCLTAWYTMYSMVQKSESTKKNCL